MEKPIIASYCTFFLKKEMRHIYRQIKNLHEFQTVVITKERMHEAEYPFSPIEVLPKDRTPAIPRLYLKYIKRLPPFYYRGEDVPLRAALDRTHARMMHVYFGHTGVYLLPFLKTWNGKALVSFHGMDVMPRAHERGYTKKLRELLQTVPLVLARSESLAKKLEALGCPREKIRLNRTGIPLQDFPVENRAFPADGKWRFVQACRLIEKKGLPTALCAFARFRQKYPLAQFTIAGEGPMETPLREMSADMKISDAVEFVGFQDQQGLRHLYKNAHVFLHPSQTTAQEDQEGVPNSMLEAMATGLPVVATLHGGIPEAVRNGKDGILKKEGDDAGIAEALEVLAANETLWRQMGQSAAENVREQFSTVAQIATLENSYRELQVLL